MEIHSYQTPLIRPGDNVAQLVTQVLSTVAERSIMVVASKIVASAENRFVPKTTGNREEKHALVRQEAEWYTEPHSSKYDLMLTVKRNVLFVNAGLDESNADGRYLLWPADPQAAVNELWSSWRRHYHLNELGVVLSDSTSMMLNWGIIGRAIAHCGFNPLRSYIGKPDLFGRPMKMEQVNVAQCVTAAAVLEMGEGAEQTPLAVVSNLPSDLEFHDHPPTEAELKKLHIKLEDDAFAPILTKAQWKKGDSGR